MTTVNYIYLHGFASSPHSTKAQYIYSHFCNFQIPLNIPDLNAQGTQGDQGDFANLTLTRQIQQVAAQFTDSPNSVRIIGSSFGGLTAAYLAQEYEQVECLVLLAPAFSFLDLWLAQLGEDKVKQWQETGSILVYHYGEKRSLPLNYSLIEDLVQYSETQIKRTVPTLIIHGQHDEVVPIELSREYARIRPWVELIELDSDHGLIDVLPDIWQAIQRFFQL